MSRKKLSKEEILALLNQESQESDSEDDFEELYSPEELQQAQEEQEQVELGWMNQAGDNSDNDEIEENQVENGDNFDNHVENVSREEHTYDRRTRAVNSIDSALDSDNFDKFKLPTNLKKYSVKVKPEVRVEGKVDWVNKPPKRSGKIQAQDKIPNHPGLAGAAKKGKGSPLKAWELFMDSQMIETLITETNKNIQEFIARLPDAILNSDKNTHLRETDETEVRGLIGLLYYRAMFHQNLEAVHHLFDDDIGM